MNIAVILLAAGPSSRMGQPKQLLKIGDESLLGHAIKIMVQSGLLPVVVLGAEEEKLRKEIESHKVHVISNPLWKTGMGSSIKAGINFIGLTSSAPKEVEAFRHKHNSMFNYYYTDGTTLKTMIRSNPGLMLLQKGVVKAMWHYNDLPSFDEVNRMYLQKK